MDIVIRKVETRELKGELFEQYKLLANMLLKERDTGITLSDDLAMRWLDDSDEIWFRYYAFINNNIVGKIEIITKKLDDLEYEINKGLGFMLGFVAPEHRHKGIATKIASSVLKVAKNNGVHTIDSFAYCDDGDRFLTKLGGVPTSVFSGMKLELERFDWNIVDDWLKIQNIHDNNLKIELHTEVTDDFIHDILDLSYATTLELKKMNNSETKALKEAEEKKWQKSKEFLEKFHKYHCFLVKDTKGFVMGFTEGGVDNANLERFSQFVTAVSSKYRGKGLGKLLKALMLDHIRQNHPQVKTITTGNNDLNASMLGINTKMGFIKIDTEKHYKINVEDALIRLGV